MRALLAVVLLASSSALAQVAFCQPGRQCVVRSFKATGAVPGLAGTSPVFIGSMISGQSAIWFGTASPTTSNYALTSDGAVTSMNGSTRTQFVAAAAVQGQFEAGMLRMGTAARVHLSGVATASLPTCNGTTEAELQYDTTTDTFKGCNAVAWKALGSGQLVFGGFNQLGGIAEETPFYGATYRRTDSIVTTPELYFTTTTAGTGGGSAVLEVLINSVQVCTLTFACADVAGTTNSNLLCSGATVSTNHNILFQWDTTSACTDLPIGNATLSMTY